MSTRPEQLRARRRRALTHHCGQCHRPWALRVVRTAAGAVVQCRYCEAVREVLPRLRAGG